DTGNQQGTGTGAAIEGYRISGKTGTAQQIDQNCKCYSNSDYWITFAGIAPSDDPRYVVGIMLDAPTRSSDGSGGQSAAPLFRTIASWLLQRDGVPLSAEPESKLILQVD
ncbi:penicillin-binding transpeptidase domain-containing protein, partial [Rhodococcus sp. R1101]